MSTFLDKFIIQNTFILANNIFKFDKPFNYPQTIQPPPLIPRAHPIFIDLSNQNQYGINNSIKGTLYNSSGYQMRPNINENLNGYSKEIIFSFKDYGYDSFNKFKEDYESMTFNFNFNMKAHLDYSIGPTGSFDNLKNWLNPIKINLSDVKTIFNNSNSQFLVNDISYEYWNSHNDNYNNWIFNVGNESPPIQKATLNSAKNINNTYVNDLLWTNDTPSSGKAIWSSVWFKIVAYIDNNSIILRYQFIVTFPSLIDDAPYRYINANANWNLQTTSLVINPKSST